MAIMTTVKVCLLIALASGASTAFAVTSPTFISTSSNANFVTPKLAEHAVADVQIRRIKHLISNQKIDPEVAFDRWEKLQEQVRDR